MKQMWQGMLDWILFVDLRKTRPHRALFHGGRPFNLDPLTLLLMNSLNNSRRRLHLYLNLFELIQISLRDPVYSLFELRTHSAVDAYRHLVPSLMQQPPSLLI